MQRKVVVVGQGYVGLPLAIRASEVGYDVVGLETDETRVKLLEAGKPYVSDVSASRLGSALRSGRYRPSANPGDIAGFDYCLLAVPTPWARTEPDVSLVMAAGHTIAPYIRRDSVIVLESTSYPGTTEDLLRPVLEAGSRLRAPDDFHLGFSPERIDPGNLIWSLSNTPKVVSGIGATATDRVRDFYDSLVVQTVPVSTPRAAELSKLLENTFRQLNIAFVNELAQFAGELGCDLWEAIEAASTKPFGYMPFQPGPGVGGHCLPVDSEYLAWIARRVTGRPLALLELANSINRSMPGYVVERVAQRVPLAGARVLLLGLGYKRNSVDMRESPSLAIAELLVARNAKVRICDPLVPATAVPSDLELVPLLPEEVAAADAVLVLTDHDCFDYEMIEQRAAYIFDARNRCRGATVDRL